METRIIDGVEYVPVVHAHWVSEEAKRVGWSVGWDNEPFGCPESTCYCSHCGKWLTASDEYHVTGKYCPNCGANMGFGMDKQEDN